MVLPSSVLSFIPSYYMQTNWLPQNICENIDKTTRNFIWKDSNNKGIHLVGWKKITIPKYLGGLGIISARETNVCLLEKLVWDLVQSSNKLWVQLLLNKYHITPHFLQAKVLSSSSPFWSSIIWAKDVLKDGYKWRPGSGSPYFWFTNWSGLGYLGSLVPFIEIHDLQLSVKDVLSSTSPHIQHLYTHLSQEFAEAINNTHFRFNNSIEDAFIWPDNKNGAYTTKSGYNYSQSWSWIWKLKLLQKYILLVWLACHDVVPTFSLLHHRNMAPIAACLRCGNHDETSIHCVRDCTRTTNIWHHISFTALDFITNLCTQDWLKAGVTGSYSNLFWAGIWWAWRHRNLTCLNNEVWSLHRLSFNIQNSVEVIKNAFSKNVAAVNSERLIKWNCLNF